MKPVPIAPAILSRIREARARGVSYQTLVDTLQADGWSASMATVRRWCLDIPKVGPVRTGRAGHSPELRNAVLDDYAAGMTWRAIEDKWGVSTGTLSKWTRMAA